MSWVPDTVWWFPNLDSWISLYFWISSFGTNKNFIAIIFSLEKLNNSLFAASLHVHQVILVPQYHHMVIFHDLFQKIHSAEIPLFVMGADIHDIFVTSIVCRSNTVVVYMF